MYIEIHHNTAEPLTETDRAVLTALLGEAPATAATAATPAPAKKAAATPAKKAAATPAPEDSVGEAEEADDSGEPTREDAVNLAKKFVADGEAAKVKAALGSVGVKRVSEIADDKIAEFVATLNA